MYCCPCLLHGSSLWPHGPACALHELRHSRGTCAISSKFTKPRHNQWLCCNFTVLRKTYVMHVQQPLFSQLICSVLFEKTNRQQSDSGEG